MLADMALAAGDAGTAARMRSVATKIKESADAQLWSAEKGMFLAATGIEHTHVVSLFTIICIRFILLN